jgi:hypothetical protein
VYKGVETNYISAAADGPNGEGTSFHHSYMGFWEFASKPEMDAFARRLLKTARTRLGEWPKLYIKDKDKEAHASWCLGHRKRMPAGTDVDTFLAGDIR